MLISVTGCSLSVGRELILLGPHDVGHGCVMTGRRGISMPTFYLYGVSPFSLLPQESRTLHSNQIILNLSERCVLLTINNKTLTERI